MIPPTQHCEFSFVPKKVRVPRAALVTTPTRRYEDLLFDASRYTRRTSTHAQIEGVVAFWCRCATIRDLVRFRFFVRTGTDPATMPGNEVKLQGS